MDFEHGYCKNEITRKATEQQAIKQTNKQTGTVLATKFLVVLGDCKKFN